MKKTLIARKVKDGWFVKVKKFYFPVTKNEVLKLIEYNELKLDKELSDNRKIIAK